VRALVLCAYPESAFRDPESVASVLADLGCRVDVGPFDLGGLDEAELLHRPPTVVVVDAGDELERAQRCRRLIGRFPALEEAPTLLAIELGRLPSLDFSIGFDDFVLRPIVPVELYARLRQVDWKTAAFGSEEVIKIDHLVIDLAGYEAHYHGRSLDLTHQEFELLRFLAQNRGRVFTRDQLLQRVWGYDYGGSTRTVDIHVRRIRAKLGPTAGGLVETVRHVGYKLRAERPVE
jgi:DNA-binding winged helix-turn-helix (wHTH) protein